MLSFYDILTVMLITCFTNNLVKNYDDFYSQIIEIILFISSFLEKILINIGYNVIYGYSYLQIKYNKYKPYINIICLSINDFLKQNKLINSNPTLPKLVLEVYGKGNNINNIILDKINNDKFINYEIDTQTKLQQSFDLIILSDNLSSSTTCINKVHYLEFPTMILYDVSNIKFISVNLTYNSTVYPIELKTDNYNHYIVNNVLNIDFFRYYLTNVLKIQIEDDFEYKVSIIDQDANFIDLYTHDILVIKENNYEIKKYISIDDSNATNNEKELELNDYQLVQ
jgi:hypothetical protein